MTRRRIPFDECWEARPGPLDSPCHIWLRSTNGVYGQKRYQGRRRGAHVVAYICQYGEPNIGVFVCHHCDEPLCVNPEHLYAGTPAQNQKDMVRRGRHAGYDKSGPNNPRATLATISHDRICDLRFSGCSFSKIGKWLGITGSRAGQIFKEYYYA